MPHSIGAIQAFYQFGMPGMTLLRDQDLPPAPAPEAAVVAPAARLRPLLRRCMCGQVVSNNKRRCNACMEGLLKEFAEKLTSVDELDKALATLAPDEAYEARKRMLPYLSFDPDAPVVSDCPKCGFKRGSVIAHECNL